MRACVCLSLTLSRSLALRPAHLFVVEGGHPQQHQQPRVELRSPAIAAEARPARRGTLRAQPACESHRRWPTAGRRRAALRGRLECGVHEARWLRPRATSGCGGCGGCGESAAALLLAGGKGGGGHLDWLEEAALVEGRVHHVLSAQRLRASRRHRGMSARRGQRQCPRAALVLRRAVAGSRLESTTGSADLGRASGGASCSHSARSARSAAPAVDRETASASACSSSRPRHPALAPSPSGGRGGHGPYRGPCRGPHPTDPCRDRDRGRLSRPH
jgi:hypothetical protein